jgi:hypothetical protein
MGDVHFRNQHAIGNYIVDFCAPRKKFSIELDGSQHLEQQEYDEERTKYFEARGYRVLRFWNNDVLNDMDTVLKTIWDALKEGEKKSFYFRSCLPGIFPRPKKDSVKLAHELLLAISLRWRSSTPPGTRSQDGVRRDRRAQHLSGLTLLRAECQPEHGARSYSYRRITFKS